MVVSKFKDAINFIFFLLTKPIEKIKFSEWGNKLDIKKEEERTHISNRFQWYLVFIVQVRPAFPRVSLKLGVFIWRVIIYVFDVQSGNLIRSTCTSPLFITFSGNFSRAINNSQIITPKNKPLLTFLNNNYLRQNLLHNWTIEFKWNLNEYF